MMEHSPDVQDDLGTGGKFKNWLQDNIRIILSVLIVLAIAGGIYSYSKRAEESLNEDIAMETEQQMEEGLTEDDAVTIIGEDEKKSQADKKDEKKEEKKDQAAQPDQGKTAQLEEKKEEQPQQPEKKDDVRVDDKGDQAATSEETGDAFVETAAKGDSKTILARNALRDYLEKNNDSSLTAEHKIYIEDYLQKRSQHSSQVKVGDQISFSKTMIKDAIEKSKTLNENQLENLKIYSSRVSTI